MGNNHKTITVILTNSFSPLHNVFYQICINIMNICFVVCDIYCPSDIG